MSFALHLHILINDEREAHAWGDVFLVLGTRRCQVAWPALGVPAGVCRDPTGAVAVAEEYFRFTVTGSKLPAFEDYMYAAGWTQADVAAYYGVRLHERRNGEQVAATARTWDELKTREIVGYNLLRVQAAFAALESRYEGEDVEALRGWARRLFVDSKQRGYWKRWGRLLRAASAPVPALAARSETGLSVEARTLLAELLERNFGRGVWERDQQMLDAMARAPLSPTERARLIIEELPESEWPYDVLLVASRLGPQRAFLLVETFRASQDVHAWHAFIRWAREQSGGDALLLEEEP